MYVFTHIYMRISVYDNFYILTIVLLSNLRILVVQLVNTTKMISGKFYDL
jgi:hypothetical protein